MAIPLPVKENFPAAFVAWRHYEPDDSRISGLAITSDETTDYWSVNYTYLGPKFIFPKKGNQSKVRPILQSKTPPNTVLKRVSIVTIPTGEIKWQAQYKVVSQLNAITQVEMEMDARSIIKAVTSDKQTGINISVELTDPQSQESVTNVNVPFTEETGMFKDCMLQDKVSTLKLVKHKVKSELTKPCSGQFISNKHKNKFFALLRIARKAIINKVTNSIKKEQSDQRKVYGKGAQMYQKRTYNAVPMPDNINVKPNLKYFEKTDLATVVAMGLLYSDDPERYFAGNYQHYKDKAQIWATGTLMRNGIPIFNQSEGRELFPHVMKRTGLSETHLSSLTISSHAVSKSLFVTIQ